MSSVIPLQVACGQFGVSFFHILCRCALIGVWPVHNWVSMLVCLQLRELIIVIYLSEGNEGSMRLVFLNLGDFFHHSFVSILIFTLISCLTAEMLIGSWWQRKVGRSFSGLEPNSAASLAKMSARSLPVEFMCPATHVKDSCVLRFASRSFGRRCIMSCLHSSSRKS